MLIETVTKGKKLKKPKTVTEFLVKICLFTWNVGGLKTWFQHRIFTHYCRALNKKLLGSEVKAQWRWKGLYWALSGLKPNTGSMSRDKLMDTLRCGITLLGPLKPYIIPCHILLTTLRCGGDGYNPNIVVLMFCAHMRGGMMAIVQSENQRIYCNKRHHG